MLNRLKALMSLGGSLAAPTAEASTRVDGDHNNVVNVVVQGGATWSLPMRTTLWIETPQDLQSVAALLRWNTRLAPLLGRETELAQLRAWADSEHPVSIQLLHAPGGQGKTRLAAEFASALNGWRHGWVDLDDFSQAEALTWQGRCLLLVDYPEHKPAQLEQLARAVERAATQPGQRLRILLVAREALAIQTTLFNRPCAAWLRPSLALADLPEASGYALVQAAMERLSVLLGSTPAPVAQADFDAWCSLNPLHRSPLLVTALAVYLCDPHWVDGAQRSPELTHWLGGSALLQRLVARETRWWEQTGLGHHAPAGALKTVMAWATLSGTLSDEDINRHLAQDQGWSPEALTAIHAALAAVCRRKGLHSWAPLEPDLLAAQFVSDWLVEPARQGRSAQDALLARALLHPQDPAAFKSYLHRLHMLSYDQCVRLGACKPDGPDSLQRTLWSWAQHETTWQQAFESGLGQRAVWPGFSALCGQVSGRALSALPGDASEAERAWHLNNVAVDLANAGDRSGALATAQEVLAIHLKLAASDPQTHAPDLAESLSNLSNFLSETGASDFALTSAKNATTLFHELAKAHPVAYEPRLALSLRNLAIRFLEVKDWGAAEIHAREAVAIRQRLALVDAVAHEPEMAASFDVLAGALSARGDKDGALNASIAAVTIYRRLAQGCPADFEPDLAASLSNLARFLSGTGDSAGALAPAQEAVAIRRRLAQANPAAYEPDLAMGLGVLMQCHAAVGNRPAAIKVGEEALSLFTTLAKRLPAAFESYREMTEQHLQRLRNN